MFSRTAIRQRAARVITMPWAVLILSVAAITATGCPASPQPAPPVAAPAPDPGPLRVLVLDDPPLAEVLEREWQARSDKACEITNHTSESFLTVDQPKLEADVIVFPSAMLGQLVEQKVIRQLPSRLIEEPEYQKLEIFDLLRRREMQWNGQPYAVTFGSAAATLLVRPDLVPRSDNLETWTGLSAQVQSMSASSAETTDSVIPLVQPLGPGWAGRVLLLRAAPYMFHRSSVSTFFDFRTLKPRIDSPPFVRALEELVADYRKGPPEAIEFSPADALDFFLTGKAALAITWPSAIPHAPNQETNPVDFAVRVHHLPGAAQRFDFGAGNWVSHDDGRNQRVTVLGLSGRLGAITLRASSAGLATTFLGWATGPEQGGMISARSSSTAPYRKPQVRDTGRWINQRFPPQVGSEYGELLRQSLERPEAICAPRLPGTHRYHDALDNAVHRALRGEVSATSALEQAAKEWTAINSELGQEEQLRAYRRGLGISNL